MINITIFLMVIAPAILQWLNEFVRNNLTSIFSHKKIVSSHHCSWHILQLVRVTWYSLPSFLYKSTICNTCPWLTFADGWDLESRGEPHGLNSIVKISISNMPPFGRLLSKQKWVLDWIDHGCNLAGDKLPPIAR